MLKKIFFRLKSGSYRKLFLISIGLILINPSETKSQNINDALRVAIQGLGSNARALGMGNSYIALSDDGSAAFFNPAGLGLLKRLEFTGGLSHLSFNNDTEFFNETSSFSNSNTELNRLSFAFPFPTLRGSLVFGLSYHTTKDLTGALEFDGFNSGGNSFIQDLLEPPFPSDIPYFLYLADENNETLINGNLNQSGSIISSGSIDNWTFSGAIEVYRNLYMGLNLNIITGNFKSDNEYFEDDTEDLYDLADQTDTLHSDFLTFHLNRNLDWDISGWDAKFGLLYQFNNNIRFGLTIQFPKTYNIKEEFIVNGYSEFAVGGRETLVSEDFSDAVEYDIITPFEIGVGLSYNLKGLILSGQATLIDYSQTKFEDVSGLGNIADNNNRNILDQLTSVFNYNLGLEYNVPNTGLRLRGGFFVQPSPYQGDPSEFNRKYATAGLGILTDETIGIDLAYAYGWWEDFGDNYGSGISRTFQDVSTSKFMITGIYRF